MDKFLHKNWMVKALQTSSWVLHLVSLLTCLLFHAVLPFLHPRLREFSPTCRWRMRSKHSNELCRFDFRCKIIILFFGLCLLASAGIWELFLETYQQTQQTYEYDKMVDLRSVWYLQDSHSQGCEQPGIEPLQHWCWQSPALPWEKKVSFGLSMGDAPETIYANRIHLLSKNMGEDYLQHVVLLCWRKSMVEKLSLFFEVTRDWAWLLDPRRTSRWNQMSHSWLRKKVFRLEIEADIYYYILIYILISIYHNTL